MAKKAQPMAAFDSSRIYPDAIKFGMLPTHTCIRTHCVYGDMLMDSLPKTSIQAIQYDGKNFGAIREFVESHSRWGKISVPHYDEDCIRVNATGAQQRMYAGEILIYGETFYIDCEQALMSLYSSTEYRTGSRKEIATRDEITLNGLDSIISCVQWAVSNHNRKARVLVKGRTYCSLLVRSVCVLLGCELLTSKSAIIPDVVVMCSAGGADTLRNLLQESEVAVKQDGQAPMLVNITTPPYDTAKEGTFNGGYTKFMHAIGLSVR